MLIASHGIVPGKCRWILTLCGYRSCMSFSFSFSFDLSIPASESHRVEAEAEDDEEDNISPIVSLHGPLHRGGGGGG